MDTIAQRIDAAATAMFMPWTVGVLLATGLYFTIRTGFVQIRRFPEAARTMVATQQAGAGGALSPFQAFMTGLAATIGVGNIAGVAAAIISGGPGALFWIWAYGFIATAVKFAEAALGSTPVLIAHLDPAAPPPPGPQFGFAGIGKPWKVERALKAVGCDLVDFAGDVVKAGRRRAHRYRRNSL